jgi:hypothetical protein
MTTEHASVFRSFKTGMGHACCWAAGIALVALYDAQLLDIGNNASLAFLIASLAAVGVGIPAWRDPGCRHPGAILFLALGAVLVGAACAVLSAAGFLLYIFLGAGGAHR